MDEYTEHVKKVALALHRGKQGFPMFKVLDSEMRTIGSETRGSGWTSEYGLRAKEYLQKVSKWELSRWYTNESDSQFMESRDMNLTALLYHYEKQSMRVFVAEGKGSRVPDWCDSIRLIVEIPPESLASFWKLNEKFLEVRCNTEQKVYASYKLIRRQAREMIAQARKTCDHLGHQAEVAYYDAIQPCLEKMAKQAMRDAEIREGLINAKPRDLIDSLHASRE